MREIEKLDAGLEYDVTDPEVDARKLRAIELCAALNAIPVPDTAARDEAIRALLGSCGEGVAPLPTFRCDHGANIHGGDDVLTNYDVTILDIAPVRIGSHVMIGLGTLISTVNHPLSAAGRRRHLGVAAPVTIGDDVWIGGNATILPGVTIGSNVVVAAGAVVTRDVPDSALVGGVPAKVLRELEDDVERG